MNGLRLCRLFTCIESALIISALKRRASSIDNLVFPVPVDPSITIKGNFLNILTLVLWFPLHENFFAATHEIVCTVNSLNVTARFPAASFLIKHF